MRNRTLRSFAVLALLAMAAGSTGCATLTSPVRSIDNAVLSAKASANTYGAGMWVTQVIVFPLNFALTLPAELGIGLWRDTLGWFTPGDNFGGTWFSGFYRVALEDEEHPTAMEGGYSDHRNAQGTWTRVPQPDEDREVEADPPPPSP